MKKIALLLVLMTTVLSCSIDEGDKYNYYILPVESYIMPSTFKVGEIHKIELKYQMPTVCYNYGGIYYDYGTDPESTTRTIGVYANTKVGESCTEVLPPLSDAYFNFVPKKAGTYTFKFYIEDDEEGKPVFEDVQVVVAE